MKNKIAIESLSMDLLRVALGYHRGSEKMAERFLKEALLRCSEVELSKIKPYFVQIISRIQSSLSSSDKQKISEDALMYSILCKNYSRKYLI